MSVLDRFRLDGQVVVVTGAGQGIGRASAIALADAGADIVLAARRTADLEAVAEQIRGMGRRALPVSTDVTDSAAVDRLAAAAMAEFGKVTTWINNAGGNPKRSWANVADYDDEYWHVMIELNLSSAFYGSRAAARILPSGGSIINVTSIAGINAVPGVAPYGAGKAGIANLTQVLAKELAPRRIRANALCPGLVVTEVISELYTQDQIDERGQRNVTGRVGMPEDLAMAMLFLASDASAFVNGQTLVVDGGGNL